VLVVEPDAAICQLSLVYLGQGPLYCEGVERLEEAWQRVSGHEGGFDLVMVSDDQCSSDAARLRIHPMTLWRRLARMRRAGLEWLTR
jgi:hypothetical protein